MYFSLKLRKDWAGLGWVLLHESSDTGSLAAKAAAIWALCSQDRAKSQEIGPNYASTLKASARAQCLSLPLTFQWPKQCPGSNSIWSPRQCQSFWSCWRWGKGGFWDLWKLLWSNKWRHHRTKAQSILTHLHWQGPISIIPSHSQHLQLNHQNWDSEVEVPQLLNIWWRRASATGHPCIGLQPPSSSWESLSLRSTDSSKCYDNKKWLPWKKPGLNQVTFFSVTGLLRDI